MRKMILISLLTIMMMGTSAATIYEVQGFVTDGTNPLDGVTVELCDASYTPLPGVAPSVTKSDGFYFLITTDMPSGHPTAYVKATYGSEVVTKSSTFNEQFASIDIAFLNIVMPEFPTIALPVAAIIGLAFIFQRRRDEE